MFVFLLRHFLLVNSIITSRSQLVDSDIIADLLDFHCLSSGSLGDDAEFSCPDFSSLLQLHARFGSVSNQGLEELATHQVGASSDAASLANIAGQPAQANTWAYGIYSARSSIADIVGDGYGRIVNTAVFETSSVATIFGPILIVIALTLVCSVAVSNDHAFEVQALPPKSPRGSQAESAHAIAMQGAMADVTRPRVLQAVSLLYILLNAVDNAIVIPGSYDLASILNVSVRFSGAIYGAFQLGWAVGALLARLTAEGWHQASIRLRIIATLAAIGCADLAYGCLLYNGLGLVEGRRLASILLALRFCTGVGSGYTSLLHWMALRVTKPSDQTSFAFGYAVATNSGMICAPVVLYVAVTLFIRDITSDGLVTRQCAVPLYPVALLWMVLALCVALVTPRHLDRGSALEHAGPLQASEALATREGQLPTGTRRELVRLGWAIAFERACMVAGIELGTTMLLETQFGWPFHAVGLGLMIVGSCTIAVCLLGAFAKAVGYGPGAKVLVAASVVGVLSLAPLFNVKGAGPPAILTADALVYSASFLTQGICDGIATNAAIENDRGYRMEDYQVGKVLGISFGRALASVCARCVLEAFGRNAYASGQVMLGLLGCATACRVASLVKNGSSKD